jgi:hypothetical protein
LGVGDQWNRRCEQFCDTGDTGLVFDSIICGRMKQQTPAYVSSAALPTLKSLLSQVPEPVESAATEAQHLSSSSGDADAYAVTLEGQSARVVFSVHETITVAYYW